MYQSSDLRWDKWWDDNSKEYEEVTGAALDSYYGGQRYVIGGVKEIKQLIIDLQKLVYEHENANLQSKEEKKNG